MSFNKRHSTFYGNFGEDIACIFLKSRLFSIIGRNIRKNHGEIDIIAKKDGITHFIEVKTRYSPVPHETSVDIEEFTIKAIDELEDFPVDVYPEENIDKNKKDHLSSVIYEYIYENNIKEDGWQIDSIAIYIDLEKKIAMIRFMENIVF